MLYVSSAYKSFPPLYVWANPKKKGGEPILNEKVNNKCMYLVFFR